MPKRLAARDFEGLRSSNVRRVVAFIIGVEEYQERAGQIAGVEFAAADATEFRDTLADIFGEKLQEMLFTDAQATLTAIQYQLRQAISSLTKDDLFIFYFAGHGFHGPMGNHFALFDTLLEHISGTGLSLRSEIIDRLKESECRRALVFADACARLFKDLAGRDGLTDLNEAELAEFLDATNYSAVYLACKPGQASYPAKPLKHGIWTYFVLQALRGLDDAALNKDGFLTDVSLRDYLKRVVPKYISANSTIKGNQDPYAIIEASSSFRIPAIPKVTRSISASADLSSVTGKIQREYFEDIAEDGVKRLAGFKTGLHTVPKFHTHSTEIFVEGLLQPEIKHEWEAAYNQIKSAFGLRRNDVVRNFNGAEGTLDTEYFRFEIRGEQSPDDPGKYRITRTLELRKYNEDIAQAFDSAFGEFDSAVIETNFQALDFEAVVERLEDLADDHGGRMTDSEDVGTYTTPNGDTIKIDFRSERIVFSLTGPSLPSAIARRLSAYRFGLTGSSQLMLHS